MSPMTRPTGNPFESGPRTPRRRNRLIELLRRLIAFFFTLFSFNAIAATITIASFNVVIPDAKMDRFRDFVDNGIEKTLVNGEEIAAHKILAGDTQAQADAKRVAKLNARVQELVIIVFEDEEKTYLQQVKFEAALAETVEAGKIGE